jgi:cytoskeletal protein RodZ
MERIGEKLRRRREELGFTIDDIARATKYRPDVIKAVEEGRAGVFPAEAYRQAFLRAYADKLGLDASEVVREQKSEEERVREALKGIRLKPRTSKGLRRTLIWLVVIVAVAAGLLLLYDRVIKVRMLGEPSGEAAGPGALGEEPMALGAPDSQAVEAPSDSLGTGTGGEATQEDSAEPREDTLDVISSRDGTEDTGSEEAAGGLGEPRVVAADRPESEATGSYHENDGAEDSFEGEPEERVREEGAPSIDEGEGVVRVTEPVYTPERDTEAAGDVVDTDPGHERNEAAGAPTSGPSGPGGRDWLAVRVRGYSIRAKLRAGDSILLDRWLEPDFSDTFYSFQPFWADTIFADGDLIMFVLNGEEVPLPKVSGGVITDFRISP